MYLSKYISPQTGEYEDDEELLDSEGATEATETVDLVQPMEDLTINSSNDKTQESREGNFEEVNLLGDFQKFVDLEVIFFFFVVSFFMSRFENLFFTYSI